jgi:hypothetical protein
VMFGMREGNEERDDSQYQHYHSHHVCYGSARISADRTLDADPRKKAKIGGKKSQMAKLFTNSTRLRSAIPDGPLAIQGF